MKKIAIFALSLCAFSTVFAQKTPPQYPTVATVPPARGMNQVNNKFPYDILIRDSAQNVFKSSDVLKTADKPLVMLFWMTTCGPCRQELGVIKDNYDAWQKEQPFRMIALSTDFPDMYPTFIDRVKKSGWQFEAYHDINHEFMWAMPGGLNGLPQVFVFDTKGNIVYHHRRYLPDDEKELFAAIKKAAEVK